MKNRPTGVATVAGLCVFALLLAALLLWVLPSWLTERPHVAGMDRHTATNAARTGVVAFLAVLGALGSLVFTGQTYLLSRREHVTDRYTKAVEQLGCDAMSVRIGGIYALERIFRDSPNDQPTIVEVLAAFIRDASPWPPGARHNRDSTPFWLRWHRVRPSERGTATPPVDACAALAVLRRRRRHSAERQLDLSATNLSGVDLHDADLTGARLEGSNLAHATLSGAILHEAHLRRALLSGANLWSTELAYAILDGRHQLTERQLGEARQVDQIRWIDDGKTGGTA